MATETRQSQDALSQLVASEVRAWVGRRMYTGRELARRLLDMPEFRDKSEAAVQRWVSIRLRGEVPIGFDDLRLFADALDVSWRDLLPSTERGGANIPYSSPRPERVTPEPVSPTHHPNGRRQTFPLAGALPRTAEVAPAAFGFQPSRMRTFTAAPVTI